ncbi:uncharacterized protein P884DRAFT_301057, partial [Thermothelomyces heterothallicus CBS 202.75]|uniref:uncharacterized protein n=1 Tax=Thermothelomyces heterothallicus CBS 202.75 TaxID=1149848 RepID=UPI0037428586
NSATQPARVKSIRDEGKVYSATGDGRVPWVSADDTAAVAAPNTDYLVLGSELLSYADIAAMDIAIKEGSEDRTNDAILTITGAPPRKFRDFAESVNHVWQPAGGS